MKFILILVGMCFAGMAKADTLDYWHVYYNNKLIGDFTGYSTKTVTIKASDIKPGDSITVRYFRDTPCQDCPTLLRVVQDGVTVITANGQGTGNPVSVAATALLKIKRSPETTVPVYYSEGIRDAGRPPIFYIDMK